MRYSIVIPCYNEEDNLPSLVSSLKLFIEERDIEIILVENGSRDNSYELMKGLVNDSNNIRITKVDVNQGYGYGLCQGLKDTIGDYVGWIHADMQITLDEVRQFLDYIDHYNGNKRLFLKGTRHNRSLTDYFFTYGMTLFESAIFGRWLFDIGAIPVFFDRSLLSEFNSAPKDFSIELFLYNEAKTHGFIVRRLPVHLMKREKGKSSWNTGMISRFRQSMRIIKASINIRKGKI